MDKCRLCGVDVPKTDDSVVLHTFMFFCPAVDEDGVVSDSKGLYRKDVTVCMKCVHRSVSESVRLQEYKDSDESDF